MRAEPFAAALNRDRFQLRRGNERSYGSIMNFDNRRKIGFDGIAGTIPVATDAGLGRSAFS